MRTREEKIIKNRKEYDKIYYLKNRDKKIKQEKEYYLNNKEKISERKKIYCLNNKEKLNKKKAKYIKKRKSVDSLYKLKVNVKGLIVRSIRLKGYVKKSKSEIILGCTFQEFKAHLESKFKPWMNWNNYGNWNGDPKEINVAWDIDHIIPLSTAKTEEDVIRLNHYTNLQPLCSYTNRHIKAGNIIVVNN
jgi:hypothetical protein